MGKRQFLLSAIHFLIKNLTRTEFVGMDHIPATGGVLIATNHLSRLDIPVLFDLPCRRDINGLIATKYKKYILIAPLAWMAEAIWIDRDSADFGAFRTAIDSLKKGTALGISPEGTRSTTGELLPGKSGVVFLALRSGVPIVPVGLTGTENGVRELVHLRRPRMVATFGPAFTIPEIGRENREAEMQYWTDEVMCRIAVLLPETYRGYYKDHPRVKELLAEGAGKVR
jgi:1-acyl-sn-glycerol-3-phosphate acyltransferase